MEMIGKLVDKWGWLLILAIIVLIAIVVQVIIWLLIRRYLGHEHSKRGFSRALIVSVNRPIKFLIWAFTVSLLGWIIAKQFEAEQFAFIADTIIHIAAIIALVWFFIGFSKEAEESILEYKALDPTSFKMVIRLIRLGLVVLAALLILPIFNVNIGGILAVGGFGGIVVGLAAKESLGNFFGAMVLSFDKPFSIGDDIRIPEKDIQGCVEYVGWRAVRVRTLDRRALYVPNASFSVLLVENLTRMTHRRIFETIGLRYADLDKVDMITKEIDELLFTHEDLDTARKTYARFTKYGDFSLEITVCCFTLKRDLVKYHTLRQEILLAIREIVEKNGADFAFPTSTVHFPKDNPPIAVTNT